MQFPDRICGESNHHAPMASGQARAAPNRRIKATILGQICQGCFWKTAETRRWGVARQTGQKERNAPTERLDKAASVGNFAVAATGWHPVCLVARDSRRRPTTVTTQPRLPTRPSREPKSPGASTVRSSQRRRFRQCWRRAEASASRPAQSPTKRQEARRLDSSRQDLRPVQPSGH
jgi:hypothetical protein